MEARIAGTDLRIGDQVELLSGGPTMTVVGQADNEIRCAFFLRDSDGTFGDLGYAAFPRGAIKSVTE